MAVEDINQDNFDKEIIDSKALAIVDMWAEWCGPCRMLSPIIEELSSELTQAQPDKPSQPIPKIKFFKLDVDSNQDIAVRYDVRSIPSVLLFKGGVLMDVKIGLRPKIELRKWILSFT